MSEVAKAAEELAAGLDWMADVAPGAAYSFRALLASAVADAADAPPARAQALLGLALAAAGRCECCIDRQTRAAARSGASRKDVVAALQRAILMADGPAMAFGASALARFDDLTSGFDAPSIASRVAVEPVVRAAAPSPLRKEPREDRRNADWRPADGFHADAYAFYATAAAAARP